MNQFTLKVKQIRETDVVTYIDLACGEDFLRVIKSKTPKWIATGDSVQCSFQEASVCIAKECQGNISIENSIPAQVQDVRISHSLCELKLQCCLGEVVSLITFDAYEKLLLKKHCDVTILLRGVDIQINPILDPQYPLGRIKNAN